MADYFNTAGISGLGFNPMWGSYPNQMAFNDLYDMDSIGFNQYSPMGAMGMNGSVWNMSNPGMMPFSPFGGNSWYQQMDQNQEFMINHQQKQQERVRKADIKINAPQEAVNNSITELKDKIMRNEQEQIMPALEALVDNVKKLYPEATDEEAFNRAKSMYREANKTVNANGVSVNKDILEDIREYGSGSFTQGLKQSLGLGLFADKTTAEQNVARITGQPVGRTEKTKKAAGNITGGAIIAGALAIAATFIKPLRPLLKSKAFTIPAFGAATAGIALATN